MGTASVSSGCDALALAVAATTSIASATSTFVIPTRFVPTTQSYDVYTTAMNDVHMFLCYPTQWPTRVFALGTRRPPATALPVSGLGPFRHLSAGVETQKGKSGAAGAKSWRFVMRYCCRQQLLSSTTRRSRRRAQCALDAVITTPPPDSYAPAESRRCAARSRAETPAAGQRFGGGDVRWAFRPAARAPSRDAPGRRPPPS